MRLLEGKVVKVVKVLGVIGDVNYSGAIRAILIFNCTIALVKNFIKN
jgi:hypothetical protein